MSQWIWLLKSILLQSSILLCDYMFHPNCFSALQMQLLCGFFAIRHSYGAELLNDEVWPFVFEGIGQDVVHQPSADWGICHYSHRCYSYSRYRTSGSRKMVGHHILLLVTRHSFWQGSQDVHRPYLSVAKTLNICTCVIRSFFESILSPCRPFLKVLYT